MWRRRCATPARSSTAASSSPCGRTRTTGCGAVTPRRNAASCDVPAGQRPVVQLRSASFKPADPSPARTAWLAGQRRAGQRRAGFSWRGRRLACTRSCITCSVHTTGGPVRRFRSPQGSPARPVCTQYVITHRAHTSEAGAVRAPVVCHSARRRVVPHTMFAKERRRRASLRPSCTQSGISYWAHTSERPDEFSERPSPAEKLRCRRRS